MIDRHTNMKRPVDCNVPTDLEEIRCRIAALPVSLRGDLARLADEAIENATFRSRAMQVAREGLERYRLDLAMARFDLEATRRERDALARQLEAFTA